MVTVLAWTEQVNAGLSEQPLYSGGHKAMQHETRNWNNSDKCEPEQQYRLGAIDWFIGIHEK